MGRTHTHHFGLDASGAIALSVLPTETRGQRPARASISIPWFEERARRLHRHFKAIEHRRAKGVPVARSVRALARTLRGCTYKTAPNKSAAIGPARLRSLFYRWRQLGRTPQCLQSPSPNGLPQVPVDLARRFILACAIPGVCTFSAAGRTVATSGFSLRRIMAVLPRHIIVTLKHEFTARRADQMAARRATRQLRAVARRQLRLDVLRSKRMQQLAEELV